MWKYRVLIASVVLASAISVGLVLHSGKPERPLPPTATKSESRPTATAEAPGRPWSESDASPVKNGLEKLKRRIRVDGVQNQPQARTESRELYFQARKIQMKESQRAVRMFEEAVKVDPSNSRALSALADEHLGRNEPALAREAALRCLAVDETDSVCHRTVIASFTRFGKFKEALPYMTFCLEVDPTNMHCLLAMCEHYLQSGQIEKAEAVLAWMRHQAPDSIWTMLAAGNFHSRSGDTAEALIHFRQACELGQPFACQQLAQHSTKGLGVRP